MVLSQEFYCVNPVSLDEIAANVSEADGVFLATA
jgi:hypothetical protein